MILSKLRRMLLGTGQRNLTKFLKQLEGFLMAGHYCRNSSQVSERRQTFLFENLCTRLGTHVAGALTERQKMFHGGSFLNLADDNKYIKNPEAQNREVRGF